MLGQSFDPTLLDDPRDVQRDACGVGFVAHLRGQPSHGIVKDALKMLARMDHRGGRSADTLMSDGAGVLVQIPHDLFALEASQKNITLPPAGQYSVGMFFLPQEVEESQWWISTIAEASKTEGLKLIFRRSVPINIDVLSSSALESCPHIEQIFFENMESIFSNRNMEIKSFFLRKKLEHLGRERYGQKQLRFYPVSLSTEKIIYKALTLAHNLGIFFKDLASDCFKSAYALVHLRFSTNTLPAWPLAQPFRMICHNGEINTLRGNINAMHARSCLFESTEFSNNISSLLPVCTPGLSDSSMLDNTIEFLVSSGRSLTHALTMVIPEPWEKNAEMLTELKSYYEYQSYLMEPWDGPALIGFAHGSQVGAILDRNGLRPARYCVTTDERVVMASEVGVLDLPPAMIIAQGRISPGRIFLLEMSQGRIVPDDDIKLQLAISHPYDEWLSKERIFLNPISTESIKANPYDDKDLQKKLLAFGYTQEDLERIIAPMANDGKEPEGSMGNDTPLAILSNKRPLLFNYFRQLFAQVTNPPIDAIREDLVTSLSSFLGGERNLLAETPKHCGVVRLNRPFLTQTEINELLKSTWTKFSTVRICMSRTSENYSLANELEKLNNEVRRAVSLGSRIIILSDRGIDAQNLAIPSLLATASVHHALIRSGQRKQTSLVIETGEAREVHHFATLLGYGADAICPWLALEVIQQPSERYGFNRSLNSNQRTENYIKAACDGLLKVMSKMGISTLQSYRGAQIFEALGLSQQIIDQHFTWTPNRIQGITLQDIEEDVKARHERAFGSQNSIPALRKGGIYRWLRNEESHLHSPEMIARLQHAVRINSRDEFKEFCRRIDEENSIQNPLNLRALLKFKPTSEPLPLGEVEPAANIMKRFATGAMSFGSISKEAHETIAMAMNKVGARSNSGEGGEDPDRFIPSRELGDRNSKIKQVASARFGVTMDYLVHAEELQIKIAQGAKPGEGGQLPGHKVNPTIAQVRHSVPGITLISPPPHHDIYSIEDLAQLIFDLKNANAKARISVKLVSESGVGTVAAGVAKAKADVILVSGHEGGTGSSPLSSISHAGLPWELGLAETQRSLLENNFRSRVILQVDGQLRTPRDLAIATLLGAEEWGLATGALISLGCIMMRKCHLNTCPVGIATHDPELRQKFAGQPEHLINYVFLLAEGLREIMAELGFRTIGDMVGRVDCLEQVQSDPDLRVAKIDLSEILRAPLIPTTGVNFLSTAQDHELETTLDHKLLIPACLDAAISGDQVELTSDINNLNRSVGTLLSSEITRRIYPNELLPESIHLNFFGSAGQSFLAFGIRGLSVTLIGEANDYVGKGLSGATIVIIPPKRSSDAVPGEVIIGNTALYGATSGMALIRGSAGERFAVRNSGARAVVEGVGDHGCEYMTGGCVVVLGNIGRNFAAGMSGGIAYLYDPMQNKKSKINTTSLEISALTLAEDEAELRSMLECHLQRTGSLTAKSILQNWLTEKEHFIVGVPYGYRPHLASARSQSEMTSKEKTKTEVRGKHQRPQGERHGRTPRIHELPKGHTHFGASSRTPTTLP